MTLKIQQDSRNINEKLKLGLPLLTDAPLYPEVKAGHQSKTGLHEPRALKNEHPVRIPPQIRVLFIQVHFITEGL